MASKQIFVTVGTTKFDDLIHEITQPGVLKILSSKGYKKMLLQIGNSHEPEVDDTFSVVIKTYRYKDSIQKDIKDADLIVSHAGAGSVLEALENRKPLLVVVNESLMDNHQTELAERLAQDEHLLFSSCKNLPATLESMNIDKLKPFTNSNPNAFVNFLDRKMGFIEQ